MAIEVITIPEFGSTHLVCMSAEALDGLIASLQDARRGRTPDAYPVVAVSMAPAVIAPDTLARAERRVIRMARARVPRTKSTKEQGPTLAVVPDLEDK